MPGAKACSGALAAARGPSVSARSRPGREPRGSTVLLDASPALPKAPGVSRGCITRLLAALLAFGLWEAETVRAESEELYVWTDEDGVVRYTSDLGRVPGFARAGMSVVRPEPQAPESNGAPSRPGTLPSLMGTQMPASEEPEEVPALVAPEDLLLLDQEIAALREAIARDREVLKELVREAPSAQQDEAESETEEQIRTIANRLPAMQERLQQLETRRERATEPGLR